MKYVRNFGDVIQKALVPMSMFRHVGNTNYWCYIGSCSDYNTPIISLQYSGDKTKVTLYYEDDVTNSIRLGSDIIKFSIENNIVKDVIDALDNSLDFGYGRTNKKFNKIVSKFKYKYINNEDIQIHLNVNKYNL